jgi:hypothetical protein
VRVIVAARYNVVVEGTPGIRIDDPLDLGTIEPIGSP